MTKLTELVKGDPLVKPPAPYDIQVVTEIKHEPGDDGHCPPNHAVCKVVLRAKDGCLWALEGRDLEAEGWFRASVTAEAAQALGCRELTVYDEFLNRWKGKPNG